MPRRKANVDKNQAEIVQMLRQVGATVICMNQELDLLVAFAGKWYVLEVKNEAGRNRLTDAQTKLMLDCPAPIHIVHSPVEALHAIGAIVL